MTSNPQTPAPLTDSDIAHRVRVAVAAAEDRKALKLKVLHLGAVTDFTDYFMICNGSSDRQVKAVADRIVETLREEKARPLHVEGLDRAQWVLLDYGDFVIHVFDDETRDYYALERLWSDAPEVTKTFLGAGDSEPDP